ncbi:regulator of G-protein signaling loco isoform X2 [Anopheles gambiae]|uniref:regulator of G-protein signaling loco isoform X2 n=1 Tax=Anopheles gambiae TaxID=7165 RepID=UPI002AC9C581|nr:regulator of G-protein signaling loco isoform X2 [Anopheles gambiae]
MHAGGVGGGGSGGGGGGGGGGAAHRRRKKRSNYGNRTVEVNRGSNGFGFTISGQQPCILSCIVAGSPADLAGLRAGDFLISVNGLNVSKLPHESVVQLIGTTHGTIRMAIAENYYSDSSDEDILFHGAQQQRTRPKYPHKTKFSRANTQGCSSGGGPPDRMVAAGSSSPIKPLLLGGPENGPEECVVNDTTPPGATTAYNVIHSPNASNSCDISNVSAMVRSVQLGGAVGDEAVLVRPSGSGQGPGQEGSLEYQAIVGYLGTIEMPKQIATSSKLQTVRSCIRKMRQEKRNPTTVLMTILPSCLNLTNTSNNLIAKYASARLSYVSSSSESDNRYFGLVTSAIYADGLMCDSADVLSHPRKDVVISNSCHVFVIDGKLVEHEVHLEKAALFRIVCTKDPITNLCLEFPSNSEYVVNLIRSMYSLKSPLKADGGPGGYGKPPVARSLNLDAAGAARGFPRNRSDPRLNPRGAGMDMDAHDMLAANSPQPSNHSEITTTSSNSDSGIGFHNDCRNISDRILLVDFPGMLGPAQQRLLQQQQIANVRAHCRKSHPFLRPVGIINEIPPKMDPIRNIRSMGGAGCSADGAGPSGRSGLQISHGKSKSADYSFPSTSSGMSPFVDRLTVRARPDPKPFSPDRSPTKENALNCMQDAEPSELMEQEEAQDRWTCGGRTLDEQGNVVEERAIDVPPMQELFLDLERYNNDNVKNSLLAARSCDDMILSLGKKPADGDEDINERMLLDAEAYERLKVKLSIDDLTLISSGCTGPAGTASDEVGRSAGNSNHSNQHVFLQPLKPVKRSKKACTTHTAKAGNGKLAAIHGMAPTADENASVHGRRGGDKMTAYKLSPKVFGLPRPISVSFENISTLSSSGVGGADGGARDSGAGDGGGGDKRLSVGVGEMYYDGEDSVRHGANKSVLHGSGTPGRKSRATKRLSGGFSAIWGSLQELRSGSFGGAKGEDRSKPVEHGKSVTPDVCYGEGELVAVAAKKKERERRLSGMKILEATYSEPDLRYDEGKTINHSASPFRRWGQSSLRSRSTEHRTPTNGSARRPSSLAASESDVYTKSIDDDYSSTKSGYNPYTGGGSAGGGVDTLSTESATIAAGPMGTAGTGGSGGTTTGPTGVASWGTSFEKLLEDAAGLHTFSEFLKKEFSAENIYFWTACERYRQLTEREERAREAQAIFARHLESGCSEPVNVDSIARNIALENLPQAEPTLFAAAQKQIFNLMKFDSYQRFIKSDLYRVCQEAEGKGQGLPYPGEQLDPMLRTSATMLTASGTGTAASITKLKKSLSNAEDRRRKSLLPWHRKTRCKSKDRGDSDTSKKDSKEKGGGSGGGGGGEKASGTTTTGGGSSSNTLKLLSTNSTSDIHSSRSSLASFDAAIGGKSCDPDDSRNTLCRVILSNGATTVVQTRSNETIKELVERLLEKRGIVYNAYEAFLAGSTKPLDLDGPSVSLAGKEVNIDQRVVFKLNLPNRKMISVKSKAAKPLADVLRPILHKYNYELDEMKVVVHSTVDVCLDMTQPVTTVDGLCLYIRSANETPNVHPELGRPLAGARPVINTATHQQIVHHFQQQQQQQLLQLQNGPQGSAAGQQQQQHTFAVPSALPPSYAVATNSKSQQLLGNGTAASATCNNNTVNQTQSRAKEQSEQQSKDDQQQQQQAGVGAGTRGQQELNSLDEITNKVFDELRNGKTAFGGVVTAVGKGPGTVDVDCASDTSSTRRDRFRRRGSNAAPSESGRGAKSKKCSTGGSEDGGESVNNLGIKKPIIAKLKAGVKLQIPTRSQNDELLEGLKRAQRSRLEDQRGTEINFELPDFLKDKENFSTSSAAVSSSAGSIGASAAAAPSSAAGPSKLTRSKPARRSEATTPTAEFVGGSLQQINKPQPAPRLSITGQQGRQNLSGPGSPVHAAVSDSHLNLSTQCNASPLPQDDPFHVHGGGSGTNGGSQSETSYADTTLVFTHARPYNGQALVTATPRTIPSSSASQHYSGDHSSDSSSTADGPDLPNLACCEHHPHEMSPDSSSPPTHANHLHPLHYHPAGAGASGANGAAGATPNGNTSANNPYPLSVHYPSHHHHHPHLHPHHHPHGQHYHHHHHHHTHNGGGGYQTATSQPVANGSNATAAPGQDGQPNAISGGAPDSQKGPPPLPPKPKILPIKPSNWGHPVAASYAPGPPGSAGAPGGGASELLGGLSTTTLSTNGSMGGSVNGTGATVGGLSPSSSTVSSHHPSSNSNGVGVGTVVGSNGIVSSTTHNDLSRGGREGNRQQRASSGNDGGSSNGSASAISVAVAQARNVYFDQGNSSFV